MKRPIGLVLYRGPSMLDGAPIVVIATGLANSSNSKTGKMVQTHIIRADIMPMGAIHSGQDKSICGDCIHRGDGTGKGRTCYVRVFQSTTAVFKAYQRGIYPDYDPALHDKYLQGRAIRFGSYGDPMAAPVAVWDNLAVLASVRTGYTHQWRRSGMPSFAHLVMASADTIADKSAAAAAGYRTFRVGEEKQKGEVLCPASEPAGRKLQCIDCCACDGQSGRKASVYIPLHGGTAVIGNKAKLESRIIARQAA